MQIRYGPTTVNQDKQTGGYCKEREGIIRACARGIVNKEVFLYNQIKMAEFKNSAVFCLIMQ